MHVCPVCKRSYDDDVAVCPEDGEQLIAGGEALPDNPDLADVVEVDPDEATAMVDLEMLQPVIAERLGEREQRLAAEQEAADAQRRRDEAAADPENTGTLFAPETSQLAADAETDDFDAGQDFTAPALPSGASVMGDGDSPFDQAQPTQRVNRAPGPQKAKKGGKGCLVIGILGLGLVLAGGVGAAVYFTYGPGAGEVLTVTTTPPGATVTVDGDEVGKSPLQVRVKAGSHTVGLTLAGYEPFKEVVDVKPGEGLPFLQPLKAIKGYKPETPKAADGGVASADGGPPSDPAVDALVASVRKHLDNDDLERALADVKELLKLAPDDPRSDTLFDEVTQARADALEPSDKRGRSGRRKGRSRRGGGGGSDDKATDDDTPDDRIVGLSKIPKAERKDRSRKAYQDGERYFRGGRQADAKQQFKLAVQLDPRFAQPHRSIARIYQREGNDKRAAYHLKRYLKLGGPDVDHRVRDWLEKHK